MDILFRSGAMKIGYDSIFYIEPFFSLEFKVNNNDMYEIFATVFHLAIILLI